MVKVDLVFKFQLNARVNLDLTGAGIAAELPQHPAKREEGGWRVKRLLILMLMTVMVVGLGPPLMKAGATSEIDLCTASFSHATFVGARDGSVVTTGTSAIDTAEGRSPRIEAATDFAIDLSPYSNEGAMAETSNPEMVTYDGRERSTMDHPLLCFNHDSTTIIDDTYSGVDGRGYSSMTTCHEAINPNRVFGVLTVG